MSKKTGTTWGTAKCSLCGESHSGYSGKLDAVGNEYVICGSYEKPIVMVYKENPPKNFKLMRSFNYGWYKEN